MKIIRTTCVTCNIELHALNKSKGHRSKCTPCVNKYARQYRKKNPQVAKRASKKHYNTDKRKNSNAAYNSRHKVPILLRIRLNDLLRAKGFKRGLKSIDYLGCSYEQLVDYLESKFQPGMTWDNRGKHGWHIDHIVPLSSAKTIEEVYKLSHFSNLQPLWAKDNLAKGAK